jgi:hypothetical protein
MSCRRVLAMPASPWRRAWPACRRRPISRVVRPRRDAMLATPSESEDASPAPVRWPTALILMLSRRRPPPSRPAPNR